MPLLENLLEKSLALIKEKYKLSSNKIQISFHYQPSFYHLHVHFTHIKLQANYLSAGRAHFLDNVINNIKLCPDYYQRAELSFFIRKDDAFYKLYEPFLDQN